MRYRAVAVGLVFDGRIVQTFSESLEIVRKWAKSTADRHKVQVDINLTEERRIETVMPEVSA